MRKKSILWSMLAMIMVAAFSASFVACGDDDYDGGSASSSAGVLDKKSGLRIKSVNNYSIYYTDNGRIDYISYYDEIWQFRYSPNKITLYDNYDEEVETVNVSYNGSGYLSGMNYSESGNEEDGESHSFSGQASMSYDGSGHLTKITSSYKETETNSDGRRYESNGTSTLSLTWRNNLLTQAVCTEKEKRYDGDNDTYIETYTYAYDNENYENKYRQWSKSLAVDYGDLVEVLAYVGLYGIGPNILPSSGECTIVEESNGRTTYSDNASYIYSYAFNSDGAITTTRVDGRSYVFRYDYADADSRATRALATEWNQEPKSARSMAKLFRHARHHR